MIRSSFLVLFLFIILSCKAQAQHFLDLNFGVNKFDFFTGLDYSRSYGRSLPNVGLTFGVNRTFFQGRIYPRISIGNTFHFVDREKFKLGPNVRYSYSFLQVNRAESRWHQWHEVMTGVHLRYGSKLMFVFELEGGWMAERFYDQIKESKRTHHLIAYWSSIGLSYAL